MRAMAKKVVSMLGTAVGGIALGHGLWQGILDHTGDPQNIPAGVVYRYTGWDINSGGVDHAQTIRSITTIAVGLIVAKALKWGARGL